MVHTWNVKANLKGLKEVEKLGRNVLCIVDQDTPEMGDCRRSYQYVYDHLMGNKPTTYELKYRKQSNTSGNTDES